MTRLLTRHGNRVGAIFYNGKENRIIPAAGGRIQVLRMIHDLSNQPRLTSAPMTDLSMLLESAVRYIKRRSVVFIVSDFISLPGWEHPLGMLSQRNELVAVRLIDPRETDLPDIGPVVIQDAETGEQLFIDTHDKKFRERFRLAAEQREERLREHFRHASVDVLSLSTDEDLVHSLVRFAGLRQQRQQRPVAVVRPG